MRPVKKLQWILAPVLNYPLGYGRIGCPRHGGDSGLWQIVLIPKPIALLLFLLRGLYNPNVQQHKGSIGPVDRPNDAHTIQN